MLAKLFFCLTLNQVPQFDFVNWVVILVIIMEIIPGYVKYRNKDARGSRRRRKKDNNSSMMVMRDDVEDECH